MKHTISNATHRLIAEDEVLTEVSPAASLLDQSRRETIRVRLVVSQLAVHVVPEVVLQVQSVLYLNSSNYINVRHSP
jgi:hypothetical protein